VQVGASHVAPLVAFVRRTRLVASANSCHTRAHPLTTLINSLLLPPLPFPMSLAGLLLVRNGGADFKMPFRTFSQLVNRLFLSRENRDFDVLTMCIKVLWPLGYVTSPQRIGHQALSPDGPPRRSGGHRLTALLRSLVVRSLVVSGRDWYFRKSSVR
jgi:hypothetical protein